ncbi:nitroreductase family deazaflavin-dependent oxidoreductase [Nocardia sp. NPDC049220]|uniref:nitroreductase family deazaflavin-dependent oxidoreductase n=1 Tax=Nocardia sp. NPDC049220 TaxID=3155273 RepID=UPI0033C0E17F
MTDFDRRTVEAFRANRGRVGGVLAGTPLILIHHIGAKSGIERVTPLAYFAQNEGDFAIVASNGGSPTHPMWYYNLEANPTITVEVGIERFPARAEELVGTPRAELWSRLIAESADLTMYQSRTERVIPLLLLRRLGLSYQSGSESNLCSAGRRKASSTSAS